MHVESFRNFCLALPHVTEDFPFGPENLVYKVGGKIFAITDLDSEEFKVNLKCEPEKAIKLRERYNEIIPGYHMNKKHWNTVLFEGKLDDDFLKELIVHSYDLVYQNLSKKLREELDENN